MAKRLEIDPAVQELLNETKAGEDEHKQRIKRYDKSYEIYRASGPRPLGLEPYRSYLRPKYGMQTIDTATVNMVKGQPKCKVLPRTPDYIDSARGFQLVFDYYIGEDNLVSKVPVTVQQALVYGVTVGKTHWLYQTGRDGLVLRDGPSYEPWDIYDAWWEPNARSVDDAEWVALRSWCSKTYLEDNRCTVAREHEWYKCDGLYHNLDLLYQTGQGRKPQTSAQNQLLGGAANLYKDRFEVVEYWRDRTLTVVGNRQIPLREMPNPHDHGKKPCVIASCRPDMFKIQGIPETELVDDLQQALWSIENLRQDNIHMTVWRGFTVRDSTATDINSIIIKPRALIPVTDHDDLEPIKTEPLPPEAYQEEEVLLSRMRDVTGITDYITGAALGSQDQNTATGISILNSAASRLLEFKAAQVHNGVWQPVFDQWGNDIQQFMSREIAVRVVGAGGDVSFTGVSPEDIVGEYDFILEGTEESLSKAQERQDAIALLTAFAPLMQAGIVNPKPIAERVARAFGFENPEELFVPAPQQQPHAAPVPQNGGQPPAYPGQQLTNGQPLPMQVQQMVQGQ